ncbi:MAG: hypothetical protein BZ135_05300 [Methanosphaera sp. rholeuAM6]|nr:MAG: hypothetical protein BZ135_05300 [Methanosphaera sp. rholeuAM6]
MATKKQKSIKEEQVNEDPFKELNEIDDDLTIETEKDFFDELEQSNLENVPEYDSKSGKIIDGSEAASQTEESVEEVEDKKSSKKAKKAKSKKANESSLEKADIKKSNVKDKINLSKVKLSKPKSSMPKPNRQAKKLSSDKKNDDTKIIDNVKVDSEGVPLLNQFDTDKIKESSFFPRITMSRISLSKVVMIVVGLIVTITGIYQAMNDVVRISDHVMYGEHGSLAYGLIFFGIIIMILAFYKEIMNMAGLNNLETVIDEESQSKPEAEDKKTEKK